MNKKIKEPQKVIKLEKLLEKLEEACETIESIKKEIQELETNMDDKDIQEAEWLFKCRQLKKWLNQDIS